VFTFDGGRGQYSVDDNTCADTSCHAPMADTAAKNQRPTWTKVGEGEAACGNCHGAPPANHSSEAECGICHKGAFIDGGVVPAKHANGIIDVGRPGDVPLTCTSCHGDAQLFRDLHDSTDPSVLTVGAHQAHLEGRHRITVPLTCAQCHQVPAEVRSSGHIDDPRPADVFPPGLGSQSLARLDGAAALWNRGAQSCSDVYCHGGGGRLARDTSPSKIAAVQWTQGSTQVFCGSCHGLPPNTSIHADAGVVGLTSCAVCHGQTIGPDGALRMTIDADGGVRSTHIDGELTLGQ
jgi:predicted CxxxxCH...CXXCH cytochrome family protein